MIMDNIEKKIAEKIKNEIITSPKTKTQIAEELGVSKPTLSQYLSGRILPSLGTFARLCKILDCSADDILNID